MLQGVGADNLHIKQLVQDCMCVCGCVKVFMFLITYGGPLSKAKPLITTIKALIVYKEGRPVSSPKWRKNKICDQFSVN